MMRCWVGLPTQAPLSSTRPTVRVVGPDMRSWSRAERPGFAAKLTCCEPEAVEAVARTR